MAKTNSTPKTVKKAVTSIVAEDKKPEAADGMSIKTEKPVYRVRETIPGNAIITVRNGFNGRLNYRSRKTGEVFVWERFGDEQDMEFQELKNARNSYRRFFENNWFLFDDPEVIDCLDIKQYYKNALSYDDFDTIFELPADEIKKRIARLSNGQKATVAYRARQLIRDGSIDSIKVINATEEALGIELIER